jgi:DNA processing protein
MIGADAWLALGLVQGLKPSVAIDLCGRLGGPDALFAAAPRALVAEGVRPATAAAISSARARGREECLRAERAGADIVTWADSRYPARLRTIAEPPLALFVRGELGDCEHVVAIVGARRAGEYGRRVASELAGALAQVGFVVVSGLAAGIDGAAHRGALEGGGRTLAVMATGIDDVYPTWHRALAGDIAAQGALVTEFPAGTPAFPRNFPQRNRIVAGLSLGVIVVEAADRSGSLITARLALEQGREVFAVPGPIGDGRYRGSHRLIQQGAVLVTSVDDVLAELAPALVGRIGAAAGAVADLTGVERRVFEAVGTEATHIDEIVCRAEQPAATSLEMLLALELRGLVEQRPGARFVQRRAA